MFNVRTFDRILKDIRSEPTEKQIREAITRAGGVCGEIKVIQKEEYDREEGVIRVRQRTFLEVWHPRSKFLVQKLPCERILLEEKVL